MPKQKGVFVFLMYFLCLGAGYILIQVALIQKFVLFLGHPTYALTVVIFAMLVLALATLSGCAVVPAGYRGDVEGAADVLGQGAQPSNERGPPHDGHK